MRYIMAVQLSLVNLSSAANLTELLAGLVTALQVTYLLRQIRVRGSPARGELLNPSHG